MPHPLSDPEPFFEPNREVTTTLGRTGLTVCRLGIGGGNGISGASLEYAISRGINYIFYSSDLHSQTYGRSRRAIRQRCMRGSERRDEIVLSVVSYVSDAEKINGCIVDQLMQLGVDHVDIFNWGWVSRHDRPGTLMVQTDDLLRTDEGRKYIDSLVGLARQVSDELRCRGYARFLGISTHDRLLAAELSKDPLVDVVMFRYNIAHRGAEHEIFPALPAARPGTVAFNTTHDGTRSLTVSPTELPLGKYVPTHSDLYRFVLDRPEVDVVLTGPTSREHIDQSFEALHRAPLDSKMRAYFEKYGNVQAGREIIVK